MIRYYRWRSSHFGGMVCMISCVGSVGCGDRVMWVRFTVACYVNRGDCSEHRGIYRSVVNKEEYTGP